VYDVQLNDVKIGREYILIPDSCKDGANGGGRVCEEQALFWNTYLIHEIWYSYMCVCTVYRYLSRWV
jgi:hypothetical protein